MTSFHTMMPFGGYVDTAHHLRDYIPQKQCWRHEQAFSSQMRELLKLLYYKIYCMDSNQILHNDKDFKVLFVGCISKLVSKVS